MVQDRSNQDEMTRLELQDKMLTAGMGGALPEMADPTTLRRVLDVGSGAGYWLIETARTYPMIEHLVGVDISNKMTAYARAQARSYRLDKRVDFQTMDALRPMEFPAAYFDLINQRLATSWVRTWEWTKLLLEYQRIVRPGGIIRITEATIVESNSPALTKLWDIFLETFNRSGRLFSATRDGVTGELVRLLTQHGFENIQTRLHPLVYRAGTEDGQCFYEDTYYAFRTLLPFFQKWVHVPSNYQEIYQQALKEMLQPDFTATWTLLTAWGTRHRAEKLVLERGLQ
jgi:ubiquinone/menaquinone biosynthesis C-methylase UbiE